MVAYSLFWPVFAKTCFVRKGFVTKSYRDKLHSVIFNKYGLKSWLKQEIDNRMYIEICLRVYLYVYSMFYPQICEVFLLCTLLKRKHTSVIQYRHISRCIVGCVCLHVFELQPFSDISFYLSLQTKVIIYN